MGKVYLVGAGPGDAELLTVKAARLISEAGAVLYDALVGPEVLQLIPRSAHRVDVGKRSGQKLLSQEEINSLLISWAASHKVVVRLKGGDPSVFGRAGEEIEALRRAGIEFELVPGVTAALGAAAAAGISLTDRRFASQLLLTTFSRGSDSSFMDWGAVTATTTLAIYMPGQDYAELSRRLLGGGLPRFHPCVIVSGASGPDQQVRWSNLSELATAFALPAPALLIVGLVASPESAGIGESFWSFQRRLRSQNAISVI